MSLVSLYESLAVPEINDRKVFEAIRIPNRNNIRVAVDGEGNPSLLLSVKKRGKGQLSKNFKLKYLQVIQNAECTISENGSRSFEVITVINFLCEDSTLRRQFLLVSESLISNLNTEPSHQDVIDTINKYVEIFRHLSEPPTKTISGLWAELFLIESSSDPETLLIYWHEKPEEKFDFNGGEERIEVKSNSQFERIHFFSSEQLNPPANCQVLVVSIFVKQQNSGVSIQELIKRITQRINTKSELTLKLNTVVLATLASSFDQSVGIMFDYDLAQESLKYYHHQDIVKIEKISIPHRLQLDIWEVIRVSYLRPFKRWTDQATNLL